MFKYKSIFNQLLVYVGFWVPVLALLITYFAYRDTYASISVITYFLFALIAFTLLSLIKNKLVFQILLFVFTFIFSLLALIDIVHLDTFKTIINSSTIYIVLETNITESTEFVSNYSRSFIFILSFVFLATTIFGLLYSHFRFNALNAYSLPIKWLLPIFIFSATLLVLFRVHFLPFVIAHSVVNFQDERKELTQIPISVTGSFKNVEHISHENETYVLIIGESTTRNHMGIYGYYRKTTPLFKKKLDELVVYEDVISPATFTIESLGKVLTLGDYDVPSKKYNNTLIQLFNSANFKTYFISNQKPLGAYETGITLIANKSKQRFYTNTSGNVLDEALLEPFQNALNDDVQSKLIVVHLLGTHYRYIKRYPSDFNIFRSTPKTNFKREFVYNTINEYDNAVLYNDFIVNSIIDKVKALDSKSFVLYLSDHGEDVFETMNLAGHIEQNGSVPMYNIPLIIWLSDKFKSEKNKFVWDVKRHYNSGELIHTMADLAGIKFKRYNPSLSLVNEVFTTKDLN